MMKMTKEQLKRFIKSLSKEEVFELVFNLPHEDIELTEEETRECLEAMKKDRKDLTFLVSHFADDDKNPFQCIATFKSKVNLREIIRRKQGAVIAEDRSYYELFKAAMQQLKIKKLASSPTGRVLAEYFGKPESSAQIISMLAESSGIGKN